MTQLRPDLHQSFRNCVSALLRAECAVADEQYRKIRLQVQGQLGGIKRGAGHIIKELGVLGLYKGATACLLRCA